MISEWKYIFLLVSIKIKSIFKYIVLEESLNYTVLIEYIRINIVYLWYTEK